MSSWLIPALLIAAQARPTRQESISTGPHRVSRPATSRPDCAFMVGPLAPGRDSRSDQLDIGLRERQASVGRSRWRSSGGGGNSRSRPGRWRVQATMDIDGPPDMGGGDGNKGVTVRDEVLLQQDAAALAQQRPTVELPDVQAPADLPQVCVASRLPRSRVQRVFFGYRCCRGSRRPGHWSAREH